MEEKEKIRGVSVKLFDEDAGTLNVKFLCMDYDLKESTGQQRYYTEPGVFFLDDVLHYRRCNYDYSEIDVKESTIVYVRSATEYHHLAIDVRDFDYYVRMWRIARDRRMMKLAVQRLSN